MEERRRQIERERQREIERRQREEAVRLERYFVLFADRQTNFLETARKY